MKYAKFTFLLVLSLLVSSRYVKFGNLSASSNEKSSFRFRLSFLYNSRSFEQSHSLKFGPIVRSTSERVNYSKIDLESVTRPPPIMGI